AFEHYCVVERIGTVEPEVLSAAAVGAGLGFVVPVDLGEDRVSCVGRVDGVWREVGDAEDRLPGGWESRYLGFGSRRIIVGDMVDFGRTCHPGHRRTESGDCLRLKMLWRRAVEEDDGPPFVVVAGDHATHGCAAHRLTHRLRRGKGGVRATSR